MKKAALLLSVLSLGLAQQVMATSLLDAYEQAKISDPIVKKAYADSQQIMEGKNQAKGALLPQLSANAGYSSSRYIDHGSNHNSSLNNSFSQNRVFSAGLTLSQSLFNMSLWRNLSLQEKTAQQAEVSYQATQQNLLYRVAAAYINVLNSIDTLTSVQAEKSAVYKQLTNTNQQYQVGLVAVTDVDEAQAQYDSVVANEIGAKNDVDNSIEALYEITGQYPSDIRKLDTKKFKTQNYANPNQYIAQGEEQNLTLTYYKMGKELAKEGIKVAQSAYLPTVNLVAGLTHTNSQIPSASTYGIADRNLDRASIGLEVSMPLYTGGQTSSKVRQQQHAFVSNSENLESTYRDLVRNIRSTVNSLNASASSIKAYHQYVKSSESAYNATLSGYQTGTRTILDVLRATRSRHEAQRQLASARYNYLLLELQLRQLSGTLNESDLIRLNSLLTIKSKL
ncbi:TolC family outer membrane protein [Testudinibacter sp. TR-2022]|uniref:TolC family outer membrane protein n=1 Tax=Testudinibacter sp. TR-2022 TaxID=2585029 RepID=UPI00111962ED|nr:TolC family outer membrane protein [Testudinibacter sp. TR-2022]TNH06845.1 TolC family outer membrane protein [Pasteurellaceae bacterium Phil11]TNH25617.1 TolC family outer membrane protein [Testudinibacter sp. TR-2022]TNH27040.1 TolC family outer membrane protein [Testudinibacter sp. TR-2022]